MFEAGYLEGEQGPVFYVLHPPATTPARGAVLYIHPFAEELNKSRRMAALQARRFAAAGFAVLLPDHFGCGDSAGDFGDARWDIWLDDLARCADWLRAHYPAPLVLWGLRAGCLLLGDLARTRLPDPPAAVVLWQPVVSGEQYLTQFLRLRMAATMMGGEKETTKQLRSALANGDALEVAGYLLHPHLADALARARLQVPVGVPVRWLEVAGVAGDVSPVARRVLDAWAAEGIMADAGVVAGEPFWATQEISEVPALIEETMRSLARAL